MPTPWALSLWQVFFDTGQEPLNRAEPKSNTPLSVAMSLYPSPWTVRGTVVVLSPGDVTVIVTVPDAEGARLTTASTLPKPAPAAKGSCPDQVQVKVAATSDSEQNQLVCSPEARRSRREAGSL